MHKKVQVQNFLKSKIFFLKKFAQSKNIFKKEKIYILSVPSVPLDIIH